MKKRIMAIAAGMILIIAIFRSEDVMLGAGEGIQLCLQVIVPSIFPFLFLSMLLTNYWKTFRIPLLDPLCKAVGIPSQSQSILLLALIGGYPVGAQAIVQACQNGNISKKQAQRLLGFCNNAGPSFIFGLLGAFFENRFATALLWLIHIGSALLVGVVLPGKTSKGISKTDEVNLNTTNILRNAMQVTFTICGWVVIFRILIYLLYDKLQQLSPIVCTVLCGALELSNGCVSLSLVSSECIRFIIASFMLGCGGLCVFMQTKSVTEKIGTGSYFPGKLMQAAVSVGLAALICPFIYEENISPLLIILPVIIFSTTLFALYKKKQ